MEEARSVIERLDRIESMRESDAGPTELLDELRGLLHEAERWARREGGDRGEAAVNHLRTALAHDIINV